jgi:hypothetical protein
MKELGYKQADMLSKKIQKTLGCGKVLAIALEGKSTTVPRDNSESIVVCTLQVKTINPDLTNCICAVVDGSSCPLNLPVEKVS